MKSMRSTTSTTKHAALMRWVAVASWASLLVIACVPDLALRVREIEVEGEEDGDGGLELEVHMFDADSGMFLGCSAGPVGSAETRFWASSRLPERDGVSEQWLTTIDVKDRNLILVVTEDDHSPCPSVYTLVTDDVIGVSKIVPGANLDPAMVMSFDRVSQLIIEAP